VLACSDSLLYRFLGIEWRACWHITLKKFENSSRSIGETIMDMDASPSRTTSTVSQANGRICSINLVGEFMVGGSLGPVDNTDASERRHDL